MKRLDTGKRTENAKMLHSIESDLLPLKMTCFLAQLLEAQLIDMRFSS